MSDLILYNYKLSPYSEKIRAMLGYAGLAWRSVEVAEMPPRPGLDILAGGYRKIPVLQVGADVFCDTSAIAVEIAALSGKPQLVAGNCDAAAQDFIRHADSKVFMAVFVTSTKGILGRFYRETSLFNMLRFIKDRVDVARKAKVPALSGSQAKAILNAHIADLEGRLGSDFLFGDEPCAADFSAYFSLWFAQLAGRDLLRESPRAGAWYERMRALGHGTVEPLDVEQALDIARAADPAKLGDGRLDRPRKVSIAPADYARDPVVGELVAETETRWTLRREHSRIGTVHLHFPKAGFGLRDA